MKKIIISLLFGISVNFSFAYQKVYIREYTYYAEPKESEKSAKENAMLGVRKELLLELRAAILSEQVLKTSSVIKNGREVFTEEFSKTLVQITMAVIEMKVLEYNCKKGVCYIKARMVVDPECMRLMLEELLGDKNKTVEYERKIMGLEAKIMRLEDRINSLRQGHNDEIDILKQEYENTINGLKQNHEDTIDRLISEHRNNIRHLELLNKEWCEKAYGYGKQQRCYFKRF